MLHEFKAIRQEEWGTGIRRWFESEGLDLVVWFDGHATVTGFQLCYDLGAGEHALTWRPERGFAHSRIDMGEGGALSKLTPVLEPDGPVPWRAIARLFDERSASLELPLRRLVQEKLAEPAARTG